MTTPLKPVKVTAVQTFRGILKEEFDLRATRNASYSLRAYARDLGISHSSLSRVMSGAQGLSDAKAVQLIAKLKLKPQEAEQFSTLVQANCARSQKTREEASEKLKNGEAVSELSLEYFKIIADWYHFAIIELTTLAEFQSDAKWIAQRLRITASEAKLAIERLLKLEMLEYQTNGQLVKCLDFQATPSDIPDRSLKLHHQQILKKAETALFEQSVTERDFSSTCFAMNTETYAWAKNELRKFRRNLTQRLAKEEKKDRLYELSIQLFALDHTKKVTHEK